VGVISPRNPVSKRYSAMEVGEVGLYDNRIRWRRRGMLRRCKTPRIRAVDLRLVDPHLPHPTSQKPLKQAEFARWGSGL
jgi:hypothetical protein